MSVDVGRAQRLSDDVTMKLVLGVTLGAVLVLALLILVCIVWLVCWRRHRQRSAETTAADVDTRVDPETTDNRPNKTRNNEPPYSRYTKDGTLVLTVTNNCTGNGSDVIPFASDTKNGIAASRRSLGKPGISTVSGDVTRCGRTTTDDVNVWPHRVATHCQAGTPCDVERDRKYDEDDWLLRRGGSDNVHDGVNQYVSRYRQVSSSSTEAARHQLPASYRDSR